jgi:transcriptional regulator with XRE-family HTH domain
MIARARETCGERLMTLDEFMEKHGITDQVAADRTGLSRGYFSRIRQGAVHPSLATALVIFDWADGKIDLRSLVPERIRNPRLVEPAPLKLKRRKAA